VQSACSACATLIFDRIIGSEDTGRPEKDELRAWAENSWHQFEDGATLGQKGSESGVILRDEEHPQEARITLERDTRTAPFAITCGIYGCMLHTRFSARKARLAVSTKS